MFWARFSALLVILLFLGFKTLELHDYRGFSRIEWEKLEGCAAKGGYSALQPAAASVGTWITGGGENVGQCLSAPIVAQGPTVEIEYGGYPDSRPGRAAYLEVSTEKSAPIVLTLPYPHLAGMAETWIRTQFQLPGFTPGMTFRLKLVDQAAIEHGGWIAIRDRISFFSPPRWLAEGRRWSADWRVHMPLTLIAAWLLLSVVVGSIARRNNIDCSGWSDAGLFGVFFLISFLTHFRPSLYFFWDEWHTLDRFMHSGTSVIFQTHNEHFIPLFLSFLYGETKLFGDNYLLFVLVSILLHAFNGILLRRLLYLLTAPEQAGRITSLGLAFFFIIHGFGPSLLHWAFLQAIICCETVMLLAVVSAINFTRLGKRSDLVRSVLFTAAAPFFFGGGLITVVHVMMIVLLQAPYWREVLGWRRMTDTVRTELHRVIKLIFALSLTALSTLVVYIFNRQGIGYGVELEHVSDHFGDMTSLLGYTFLGGQLGTVLRGLGVFPILELEESIQLFPADVRAIFDHKWVVAGSVAGAGLFVLAMTVFLVRRFARDPERTLRYLLLGELIISSTLFLPALGRAQWGLLGSLAIRYHYATLVGLAIMLIPLFERAIDDWRRQLKSAYQLFVILIFALQIHYAMSFDYFTKLGRLNRDFITEMREWRGLLAEHEAEQGRVLGYDAAGSEYAGLEPWIPYRLAPDYHPDQVEQVLDFLRAESTGQQPP